MSVVRWSARALLVAVLAATTVFAIGAPAHAHGQLVFAEPAADSTITEPVDSIALYFTERPASNAFFTVIAPDGRRVENGWSGGEPKQLDEPIQEYFLSNGVWEPRLYATGFPILVRFAHWPAPGRYTVAYLSVASDGEEVKGSVAVTYAGPLTAPPAGWTPPTSLPDPNLTARTGAGSPPATAPPAAVGSTGGDGSAGGFWIWLVPAVLVVVVVVAIVRAGTARTRSPAPARKKTTGGSRGKPAARRR